MNQYRVSIQVGQQTQIRIVKAVNAGMAAHRARHAVVNDGWSFSDIGGVRTENVDDGHDVWESRPGGTP
jgi:hypothetical protein